MIRQLNITSVESKASFQEKLLEKFVQQNLPPKAFKARKNLGLLSLTGEFKEIESCAAETPVYGTVEIFYTTTQPNSTRRVTVPVCSRFFVFCTRNDQDDYKVSCSSSLS